MLTTTDSEGAPASKAASKQYQGRQKNGSVAQWQSVVSVLWQWQCECVSVCACTICGSLTADLGGHTRTKLRTRFEVLVDAASLCYIIKYPPARASQAKQDTTWQQSRQPPCFREIRQDSGRDCRVVCAQSHPTARKVLPLASLLPRLPLPLLSVCSLQLHTAHAVMQVEKCLTSNTLPRCIRPRPAEAAATRSSSPDRPWLPACQISLQFKTGPDRSFKRDFARLACKFAFLNENRQHSRYVPVGAATRCCDIEDTYRGLQFIRIHLGQSRVPNLLQQAPLAPLPPSAIVPTLSFSSSPSSHLELNQRITNHIENGALGTGNGHRTIAIPPACD